VITIITRIGTQPITKTRLEESDIAIIKPFVDGIADRVREIDPSVEVDSQVIKHASLDLYLLAFVSPQLTKDLGRLYPLNGAGDPTDFASMYIYRGTEQGFDVLQRFDLISEAQSLVSALEVATNAQFHAYAPNSPDSHFNTNGLLTFRDHTDDLQTVRFLDHVELYYEQSEALMVTQ